MAQTYKHIRILSISKILPDTDGTCGGAASGRFSPSRINKFS